jgi:hypothetical protein
MGPLRKSLPESGPAQPRSAIPSRRDSGQSPLQQEMEIAIALTASGAFDQVLLQPAEFVRADVPRDS